MACACSLVVDDLAYNDGRRRAAMDDTRSALGLPGGLSHHQLDRQFLAAATVMGAAHRRGALMVEPDGDTDVLVGDADLVGGIEPDPAEAGHMGFDPGVADFRAGGAFVAAEIARHISRRHPAQPCERNEDVAEIAAVGTLAGEGFGGGTAGARGIGVAGDILMQADQQAVQQVEGAAVRMFKFRGVGGERRVRARQGGLAQEQARRKPLYRAAHDPGGVLGLHLALDHQAQIGNRAGRRERMGEVAERVLLRLEPAVCGDVDAPIDHILPGVVARRQAQRLDHAGAWGLIAIDGFVRDADAHGGSLNRQRRDADAAQLTTNYVRCGKALFHSSQVIEVARLFTAKSLIAHDC
jgi:hypothetical protein